MPLLNTDINSTWRTLVPVLEDRPLALCDSRSVDIDDLVAADRIIPSKIGEVYYLTYNEKHEWQVDFLVDNCCTKLTSTTGTGSRSRPRPNLSSSSCMTQKMALMLDVSTDGSK